MTHVNIHDNETYLYVKFYVPMTRSVVSIIINRNKKENIATKLII